MCNLGYLHVPSSTFIIYGICLIFDPEAYINVCRVILAVVHVVETNFFMVYPTTLSLAQYIMRGCQI